MGGAERVTRERSSSFFAMPSSWAGRWSAFLLLLSLVLVLLNTLVVMPLTERSAALQPAQLAVNGVVFLSIVASGVSGLIAAIIKHERSWSVMLSVLILVLLVGFAVSDFVIRG